MPDNLETQHLPEVGIGEKRPDSHMGIDPGVVGNKQKDILLQQVFFDLQRALEAYAPINRSRYSDFDTDGEPEIPEIPTTDLDASEISNKQNQLDEESKSLVASIRQLISLINQKAETLQGDGATLLQEIAADVATLVMTIAEKQQRLGEIQTEISILDRQYGPKALARDGFANIDEVKQRVGQLDGEIQALNDQRDHINRNFFRRQANNLGIKNDRIRITQQIEELRKQRDSLRELQGVESKRTSVQSVEYNKNKELRDGIIKVVAVYTEVLVQQIDEELGHDSDQEQQDKEACLTDETLRFITDFYIDTQAGSDLKKLPEELRVKVISLVHEVAAHLVVDQKLYWGTEDERVEYERREQKATELKEKIVSVKDEVYAQASVFNKVSDLINRIEDIRYPLHEQFQEFNRLVQSFPLIKRRREVAESFLPAISALEQSVLEAGLSYQIGMAFSELSDRKTLLELPKEAREFVRAFDGLDLSCWDAYRDSPQAEDKADTKLVLALDSYLSQLTQTALIGQREHTDESMKLGRRLLHFRDPGAVPINIMNAFRESGPSGNFMLIDINSNPEETDLYRYLTSLNDEELQAAIDLGIPQVGEIITLIKEHSDTFSQRMVKDKETQKYVNNPVYFELEGRLAEMGRHYLELKDQTMYLFVTRLLIHLTDVDISAFYPYLAEIFTSQGADVQKAIFDLADRRLSSVNADPGVAYIILAAYPTLDAYAQEKIKRGAPELFAACIKGEMNEEQFQTMCQLLDRDQEEVERTVIFLRRLRESTKVHHYYDDRNMDDYFQLAKHEGMADLIEELAREGYYFQTYDSPALPLILAEKDAVLGQIKTIKKYIPEFLYAIQHNYHSNTQNGSRDTEYTYNPYEVLIGREKIPESLYEQLTGEGRLPREFSDGLIRALRRGDRIQPVDSVEVSEQELDAFHTSLQGMIAAIQDRADTLYVHRDFFQNVRCLKFLARYPDKVDDLLSLGREGLLVDERLTNFYINNLDKLLSIPRDKRSEYVDVLEKVSHSPSQEIQRIKDQLLKQLLLTDNPISDYNRIEQVFISNNLPTVGKVFKIFDILHPKEVFNSKVSSGRISPYLVKSSERRRKYTLFNDLIKVHLGSGNRSLRDYFQSILDGEQILASLEEKGLQELGEDEQQRLAAFISVLNILYENSQLGRSRDVKAESPREMGGRDLIEGVKNIIQSLEVDIDQSISDRLAEMFLQPIGVRSFAEALEKMREVKQNAHRRGLSIVERGLEGFSLEAGDLIKGVSFEYISNILQNGSVAKEFLGANADSDATPFDTDLSMVTESDAESGFMGAVSNSIALNYGGLLFVVKNRGQMQETTTENVGEYDPSKMELFHTGSRDDRHYGIRTGFPTTEIDFMIALSRLAGDRTAMEKIYYEIAQNGFYIPIVDNTGIVLFTPEMYAEYRQTFNGIRRFEGDPIDFRPTLPHEPHFSGVEEISAQIEEDSRRIENMYSKVESVIKEVLLEEEINLKDDYDHGLLGAELMDIGSTGRHTNKIRDFDFDLTLKLDDADMSKVPTIVAKIIERLKPQRNDSHSELDRGYYQLRAIGSVGIEGSPDVDIGITRKSELAVYGSHDAIADKLSSIRQEYGEDAYRQVIANIILTKNYLNEGSAYKRVEHGGFGGIGVENWILANRGNMVEAFQTFWDAAHDGDRQLTFDEFKERYKVFNAGMNVKRLFHDNYIENMKPQGYEAMLRVIRSFLHTEVEKMVSQDQLPG